MPFGIEARLALENVRHALRVHAGAGCTRGDRQSQQFKTEFQRILAGGDRDLVDERLVGEADSV